ncbi:alpha/beta fold hydrolase [Nocardia sp. NPDC088792]|uniref:alpha/beta fold hydrolase n=1 Tax=Nocardia sp. NPDC088792 TaxID=3364332 RepID=UPI00381DF153
MPFVTTDDGAKIHYLDTGGDGPAVLLMHGIFMDADMWAPQLRSLAPDYRVIAVDSRGHGLTEDPGVPFDYWRLAQDAWQVADRLGLDRIVTGGLLQGGWTGLRMALQQPGRVRGLILVGSRADAYDGFERPVFERVIMDSWILGDEPLEPLAKLIAVQQIGGDVERHQQFWVDKWLAGDRRRPLLAGRALIDREGIEDRLGEITAPALLMHGVGDPVQTRAKTEAMAGSMGGPARVETIDAFAAAHAVTWTHPELTDPLIRDFLAGLPNS